MAICPLLFNICNTWSTYYYQFYFSTKGAKDQRGKLIYVRSYIHLVAKLWREFRSHTLKTMLDYEFGSYSKDPNKKEVYCSVIQLSVNNLSANHRPDKIVPTLSRTQAPSALLVLSSWLLSPGLFQWFHFPLSHCNSSHQEGEREEGPTVLFQNHSLEVVHMSSAPISQNLKTLNSRQLCSQLYQGILLTKDKVWHAYWGTASILSHFEDLLYAKT